MKKAFRILVCVLFLCSCSGGLLDRAKDFVSRYDSMLTTDTSAALTFWSSDIFKANEISANVELQVRDFGSDPTKTRFENLGAKVYKTWVFSGTIFKDVVEVETRVVVPSTPQKGDLVQSQTKVFRQLTYVAEIGGTFKILESQMREMK
ncbi:MAG: hypothetical protein HGA95_05270 [Caldiserica bacterium]|nr:hypothetical protein [Caldisericota bacterium]